jgi:hypothetical protein
MPAAVTGKLRLTTDLERTLAAQLAVARRYGTDRDREIVQLERRLRAPPTAAPAAHPADVDEMRQAFERLCSRLLAYVGHPVSRQQAAGTVERLIAELRDRVAEIRSLRSQIERLRDGTAAPLATDDGDPVVYTIRESDFAEPLAWLVSQITAAHRERHPEAPCATPSSSTTRSKSSSTTSTR